jgi:hypothetical protein
MITTTVKSGEECNNSYRIGWVVCIDMPEIEEFAGIDLCYSCLSQLTHELWDRIKE